MDVNKRGRLLFYRTTRIDMGRKNQLLPFIWITGLDEYIGGKGNFEIKLMSYFTIADAPKCRELGSGEIIRWLGEAPLFPTALLPSNYLQWQEIDLNSARAVVNFTGLYG